MRLISLTKNKTVMVDSEDYGELSKHKWCFAGGYAVRGARKKDGLEKRKNISMHRQILGVKKEKFVDHINGNTLDNRKQNLRECTFSLNQMNKVKKPFFDKERKKWSVFPRNSCKNL